MSILLDRNARILIQGITGGTGRAYAARMAAAGTPLVGGVSPGRAGQEVSGVPVFDTVAAAVAATGADCLLSAVPAAGALDAMLEAFQAGIRLAVLYTEGVPVHDAMRMRAYARAHGALLFGPNSAGVITPGQANMADISDQRVRPGRIGIVSKSGTLTYEVMDGLHANGFGESTVVCLGGDPVVGTSYADILPLFEQDPDTDAVVLVGEPGGTMEYEAARIAATMRTPVLAYITGQHAPPGKRMGHAGAIGGTQTTTAMAKRQAFEAAGCLTTNLVTEIGAALASKQGQGLRPRTPTKGPMALGSHSFEGLWGEGGMETLPQLPTPLSPQPFKWRGPGVNGPLAGPGRSPGLPSLVRVAPYRSARVRISVDGAEVLAHVGQSVLSAVLAVSGRLRVSEFDGGPRAGFCLMGACQDCWVWFADGGRGRACSTLVAEGMAVLTAPPAEPG